MLRFALVSWFALISFALVSFASVWFVCFGKLCFGMLASVGSALIRFGFVLFWVGSVRLGLLWCVLVRFGFGSFLFCYVSVDFGLVF